MRQNAVNHWRSLMKRLSGTSSPPRAIPNRRLEFLRLEERVVPTVFASDDFVSSEAIGPIAVHVLDNDQTTGAPIDPTSVKVVAAPSHGSFSVSSAGVVTYTPNASFSGTDKLGYNVADTNGSVSNTAQVTIVVSRPIANDDIMDTDGTNPVTVDILANDTAPVDGSNHLVPSSVQIVSNPQHGTFTLDPATGAVTYTAADFFNGSDSLAYTVQDSNGATSNVAIVTVVVHRPTANDDAATTTEGQSIVIPVLANDTDPDGNQFLDPTSVVKVGGPFHGTATVDHTTGAITYTPNPNFTGTDLITYTVADTPGAVSNVAAVRITVAFPPSSRIVVTGADAGGGPQVNVYNTSGVLQRSFLAYSASFSGGVRVAVGDVNGDGVPDIVTAAGPGGGPHVEVFDGKTGQMIQSFFAYAPNFTGGVNIAVADVNGDGFADIVTGAGAGGGPHVEVFSGKDGSLLQSFFAYDAGFSGGVSVAAGDVTGDGRADIITGAGAGGGPHVKVFDGQLGTVVRSFFAYTRGLQRRCQRGGRGPQRRWYRRHHHGSRTRWRSAGQRLRRTDRGDDPKLPGLFRERHQRRARRRGRCQQRWRGRHCHQPRPRQRPRCARVQRR